MDLAGPLRTIDGPMTIPELHRLDSLVRPVSMPSGASPEIVRRVRAYNDGVEAFHDLVARAREALAVELYVPVDVHDALAEAASQLLDERARLSGR